ncbi:hypothetical protein M409DRAFT_56422 [Zasmidium cellare ATCC 36951]|uniref:DUF7587 domain-containing protein n=1 Tax=Zasmidium cellare ATCC 36951 TaxID=1080233 RepID=A0A6A6CED6_ZASCE|nr:uncharacterized protein M409DRAFT_56422 [Zasmidium cellare ATCC 36951]KAF2164590.1 hypothetical protein M409DRAFT_56422 [Zasmidium cellare ATCC 36951]
MPPKRPCPDSDNEPRKRHASEADVRPKATPSTPRAPGPRRATTAGLTDGVQDLKLSPAQEAFRRRVDEAAKGTPRFLFRFWSHRSGGNKELNTVDGIIPLAFLGRKGPVKSFYQMCPEKLGHLAREHVKTAPYIKTVYSFWSQSLDFVLNWAQNTKHQSTHISILDTAQVNKSNIILHTNAVNQLFGHVGVYEHEYLICGTISGPAYRAVPLEDFLPCPRAIATKTDPTNLEHATFMKTANRILQIARGYSGGLELPIAAHLMGFVIGDREDTKMRQQFLLTHISRSLPIPAEWINDPTIVEPEVNYRGVSEAHRAAMYLSEMVKLKLGGRKSASTTGIAKNSRGPTDAEIQKATDSVVNSPRVPEQTKRTYPRMVTELRIRLTGWEWTNETIEEYKKGNP